jgi:hypothetical protein
LHPSSPQSFPVQSGVHGTQAPASQCVPAWHGPHEPPHPSSPHALPVQSGVQQPFSSGHAVHTPGQQSPYWKQTSSQ